MSWGNPKRFCSTLPPTRVSEGGGVSSLQLSDLLTSSLCYRTPLVRPNAKLSAAKERTIPFILTVGDPTYCLPTGQNAILYSFHRKPKLLPSAYCSHSPWKTIKFIISVFLLSFSNKCEICLIVINIKTFLIYILIIHIILRKYIRSTRIIKHFK